jgi:hypothetical protein
MLNFVMITSSVPPPKLLGEPSEVNVGAFIKRIGQALNGIPVCAMFNLVRDPHHEVDALNGLPSSVCS